MADDLAAQTAAGKNLANCFLWTRDDLVPRIGSRSYIKNSKGEPVCIVEVIRAEKCAFADVAEDFARAEGYDSLAVWRAVHQEFFGHINNAVNSQTLVVCQWFRVVHVF